MLNYEKTDAVLDVRRFFDDILWHYAYHQFFPGSERSIFPGFGAVQTVVPGLEGIYGVCAALFIQGHAADDTAVHDVLPPEIIDSMEVCGLLAINSRGEWRTPNVAIVPVNGLLLAVSTPPYYPTTNNPKQPVYIGLDSLMLVHTLPLDLRGRRVLDICAGSGIQGLTCAARGADKTVCLEMSDDAVRAARFNAVLNGLDRRIEVRQSDLLTELGDDEDFDFVASNPPFMPVVADFGYPICGDGGEDGTRLMRRIFAGIGKHLAPDAEGVMICDVLGDEAVIDLHESVLDDLAASSSLSIRAYISNKWPVSVYATETLAPNLRLCCPETSSQERDEAIAAWARALKESKTPADFVYEEIIRFRKTKFHRGFDYVSFRKPHLQDPMFYNLSRARDIVSVPDREN